MTREIIRTDKAAKPVGAYPHARRLGNVLYLSGVGPRRPVTGEIPGAIFDAQGQVVEWDVAVQTRSVIDNVRAVLEAAGSSLEKIVDVQVYLVDMKRDFAAMNQVWAEIMGPIQATRTTIEVGALPTPIAVEFKVIAEV